MARPSGPKTRCSGQWTEAKFHAFIKNNLRRATIKWAPIQETLKEARVSRGIYLCASCGEEMTASIKNDDGKRLKNAIVDHIQPIIDPAVGFTTWDECIDRMFCEKDNLQVVCRACHDIKSNEEKARANSRREKEKNEQDSTAK